MIITTSNFTELLESKYSFYLLLEVQPKNLKVRCIRLAEVKDWLLKPKEEKMNKINLDTMTETQDEAKIF